MPFRCAWGGELLREPIEQLVIATMRARRKTGASLRSIAAEMKVADIVISHVGVAKAMNSTNYAWKSVADGVGSGRRGEGC